MGAEQEEAYLNYRREWYRQHRDDIAVRRKELWDANPERFRALSRASYERRKEKARVTAREWHKKNPERSRELHAAYKARKKGAPRSEPVSRAYVIARDGSRCHICGRKVRSDELHLDHLVPLSKGGDHTSENLRVAHAACNIRRRDGRLPAQLLLVA